MHLPLLLAMTLASTCAYEDGECRDKEALTRALETYRRSHMEFSFGYFGAWTDETNRALELKSAEGDALVAGRITDPFLGKPYLGSVVSGPMIEARAVASHVRFTVGARFPFTNFRPSDTVSMVDIGGTQHEVLVRSLKLWDFRTGIGFELPMGSRVTGFIDTLGDVQFLTTQVIIDGAKATYSGTSFGLGLRAGARVQVNHLFLQLAGETTLLGVQRYGGSFMVGAAF
ncbi:MAG: hypothetical protein ACO1OB_16895 [Archangium sp.]